MSLREFLTSSTFIVVLLGLLAALELAIPMAITPEHGNARRRANLAMTVLTLVFNWGLISAAAWSAASPDNSGLLSTSGLPLAAQAALGIVVLDFAYGYLAHRLMHASPFLWKFHRVHHADAFVDVTTTYRTHPVEGLWRYAFLLLPIRLLGIPASAIVIYRALSVANAALEHANIRVRPAIDLWISRLWVTPNMHKVHHSRIRAETDSNYGNILAIHDRLLGTFTPTDRAFGLAYGLDDAGDAANASATQLLAMPFSARRGPASQVSAA